MPKKRNVADDGLVEKRTIAIVRTPQAFWALEALGQMGRVMEASAGVPEEAHAVLREVLGEPGLDGLWLIPKAGTETAKRSKRTEWQPLRPAAAALVKKPFFA